MRKTLLLIPAVLLHPIWLPFAFAVGTEMSDRWLLMANICLVLPAIWLAFYRINPLDPDLAQRRIIFTGLALFYVLAAYLALQISPYAAFWMASNAVAMGLLAILAFRWRISWHVFGWAFTAGFMSIVFGFWWREAGEPWLLGDKLSITAMAITFLVGILRYVQKAHSLAEIASGLVLGAAYTLGCYLVILRLSSQLPFI